MNIEQWLDQYGYWAVFFGVFLEGPLTLTLAGFLAHQGYLNSLGVLLTAFVSVFLVIEVVFFIGYFFSHAYGMFIDDVKRYEKPIALVLVAIVIIYYIARRLIWRKVSAEKP